MNDSQSQLIPLNRLKKSPKNVRQMPHGQAHIEVLADSIEAHGQIQNLVVETELDEAGHETGSYLVTAGEGRRLAQLLRVKRKRIKANEGIRCVIDDTHSAQAVSLAENELRQNMHGADQFLAFKQLVDGGQSIEDVAAQFGVTPLVVQRRLKLANLHPDFLALYRADEVNLQVLMALALTDDQDKQRQIWNGLPPHERHPDAIRDALSENELSVRDPIARFAGLKAYTKAGGGVRRDLFSEDDEGYLTDGTLARQLAVAKLEKHAKQVKAEGAAWVEIMLHLDYSELHRFGRVRTVLREPTEEERSQLETLAKRRAEIDAQLEQAESDEDRLSQLSDQADEVDAGEDEITERRSSPHPDQQTVAGAIVSIDRDGKLRIERGLLKPEDVQRFKRTEKTRSKANGSGGPRLHSEVLMRRLTAHRTLALQATVAQRPDVALVALAHRLVLQTFYGTQSGVSAVQIKGQEVALRFFADDLDQSKAHEVIEAQRGALRRRLPEDRAELWGWLLQQPQPEVLALLAFCVAGTINGVQSREGGSVIDSLARAVDLDMREFWVPSAQAYFGSLPKARILSVVREAVSTEAAAPLALLKKDSLAATAAERIAGTGWLPEPLRTPAA